MDELDRKLLKLVQADASLSLEAISESVNLSRNACWRRIKALEADGIITSRVTLLDPDKLGLGLMVFMMIRTRTHTPEWLDGFRKATKNIHGILGAYRMTGDLDYLIRARVTDMADYDRLYQQLIRHVDLSDVSASFVMEHIKETHQLPVE